MASDSSISGTHNPPAVDSSKNQNWALNVLNHRQEMLHEFAEAVLCSVARRSGLHGLRTFECSGICESSEHFKIELATSKWRDAERDKSLEKMVCKIQVT